MSVSDPEPSAPAGEPPASQPPRPHWTFSRVLGMILAGLVGLIGVAMLLGAIGIFIANGVARDDDGFLQSGSERFQSAGYAITTDELDLDLGPGAIADDDLLGTVRISAEASTDAPVFVGIGPQVDVQRYLGGVRHDVLVDFDDSDPQLEPRSGNLRPQPPGRQGFWAARASGAGEQSFDWEVDDGVWTVVVMNADASQGVDVEAEAGVKLDWLIWVAVGLLIVGIVLTAGGAMLIVAVSRRASRDAVHA